MSLEKILALKNSTQLADMTKCYGNRFARSLGHRLAGKLESACIQIQGDSSCDFPATNWVIKMVDWLALKYPDYSVVKSMWNTTNEGYDMCTVKSVGANGMANVYSPGTTGHYISTADKNALDITGDIEIIVKIAADDYKAGADRYIVSKYGVAGNKSWGLGISATTGIPYFVYTADGTNATFIPCNVAPTVNNGADLWLKFTLDVDNGASGKTGAFYTSSDGTTWTQLGWDAVSAGTTSIFNSTAALVIGANEAGSYLFAGKIYKVVVKNGIGGKSVVDFDAGLALPVGTTSCPDLAGNTFTINGASMVIGGSPTLYVMDAAGSGRGIGYSTDATRFDLQTPIESQLAFISYGHNDYGSVATYQTLYEGLCTQLLTKYPNTGIVCTLQNPQISPKTAANIKAHTQIMRKVAQTAAKNDYGMVDVFRAFIEYGDYSSLINSDGVHPSNAGFQVWMDEVEKFLKPATK